MPKVKIIKDKYINDSDPNPIHNFEIGTCNLSGCISGIQLIDIANKLLWENNVYCASEINISFFKPIFPDDELNFNSIIKEKKIKSQINEFTFSKNQEIYCRGKIKQILH